MLKYCLGVDVSKNDFHCCICVIDAAQKVTVKGSRKFPNNREGFKELRLWTQKQHKDTAVPLVAVMEATGVYYEQLALFLFQNSLPVSVVLPNKAKKYLQATGLKSKNDKIDAQGLARMGAEQCLDLWEPMGAFFYELRSMTRQHQSLQEMKTAVGNQAHALALGMYESRMVATQLKSMLATIDKQIAAVELAIEKHIASEQQVKRRSDAMCAIKGLGRLTVAVVLAETNGFALFQNTRQLTSYAGYDVVECASGMYKGKTRISKRGNSRIRRALHMPAFNVVRYEQAPFTELFHRTLQKHGRKMKSYVAVQKKLLTIIYTLWKKDVAYEPKYQSNGCGQDKGRHTGETEQASSSRCSEARAAVRHHTVVNKSSALPKGGGATQGRHTVETSQHASSR